MILLAVVRFLVNLVTSIYRFSRFSFRPCYYAKSLSINSIPVALLSTISSTCIEVDPYIS